MTADKARRHDARTSAAAARGSRSNLVGSVAVAPTNVHSDATGAATSGTRLGRQGPDGDPAACVRARAIAVAEQSAYVKTNRRVKACLTLRRESSWIRRWNFSPRPAGWPAM